MNIEEKVCSKRHDYTNCIGTGCAQFASCMILEIEAMEDLGIDASDFEAGIVNAIKESFK